MRDIFRALLDRASWHKVLAGLKSLCPSELDWPHPEAISLQFRNKTGLTLLMVAVHKENTKAVQWLLEHQASIKLQDSLERTPLHLAVSLAQEHRWYDRRKRKGESVCIVKLFCPCIPSEVMYIPDKWGFTPLHLAVKGKNTAVLQLLLPFVCADMLRLQDNRGWTPLHAAVCYGSPDMVKLLHPFLSADILCIQDDGGNTPVHIAVARSRAMVNTLLDFLSPKVLSIQEHFYGHTPLHVAIEKDHPARRYLLPFVSAEVMCLQDKWGCTPLHTALAVSSFSYNTVAALSPFLTSQCLGLRDRGGRTPLEHSRKPQLRGLWMGNTDSRSTNLLQALMQKEDRWQRRSAFVCFLYHYQLLFLRVRVRGGKAATTSSTADVSTTATTTAATPPESALRIAFQMGEKEIIRRICEYL